MNERRVVALHRDDIAEAGFVPSDVVDLTSLFEGQERVTLNFIIVEYSTSRRCAATYCPEANVLVAYRQRS